MKVQIYTMQTLEEAIAVAELGVDHLGITPSNCGLPGEIDFSTARAIVDGIPKHVKSIALSVETELKPIVDMVAAVQPDILHLCALEGTVSPTDVQTLRDHLPGLPIMQAVSVAGPQAIEMALAYQDVAEYIILDTQAPDINGIGASGEIHDWAISREIVRQVNVPVILAGGLAPNNVVEAARVVQPWGVDSLTHTNQVFAQGGFKKDLVKIEAFVKNAQQAHTQHI